MDETEYAGLGEFCGGFNAATEKPFPRCEPGLECTASGLISIVGAGNICTEPIVEYAGLGEICEGFDFRTELPFPECEPGLECVNSGLITIPGYENICADTSDPFSCTQGTFNFDVCLCSSPIQCALACLPGTIPDPIDNCFCHDAESFNHEYAHTLGPDCLEGTDDDFLLSPPLPN